MLGLAVAGAGGLVDPAQFFRSYLVAYLFWTGIALGSLGAGQPQPHHRRPLGRRHPPHLRVGDAHAAAAAAALPAARCFGLHHLYEWARPEAVAHDALLQHKAAYLNVPFFLVRAGDLLRRLDRRWRAT